MAMTDIPITTLFPPNAVISSTPGLTVTLNSNDDWLAGIFYWPGGDLTKFAFVATSVTGSNVVTVQVFNVDPTNTTSPVNTASPIGSAVDSGTLVANTIEIVSSIGQAALAAGYYAIRIIFKSGTSVNIIRNNGNQFLPSSAQFPSTITVTNGAAQTKIQGPLSFAVGGSSFVPIVGLTPPVVYTNQVYDSSSSPDEYGLHFTNPWPVDVRVCGIIIPNIATTPPDWQVNWYDDSLTSPTIDFSMTLDKDLTSNTAHPAIITFTTKQTLLAAETRSIGIRAMTTDTGSSLLVSYGSGNQQMMDTWYGQNATLITRIGGAGALTQSTFQHPILQLLIDGINPGSGAGGSAHLIGHAGLGFWPMIRPNSRRRTAKWGNRG